MSDRLYPIIEKINLLLLEFGQLKSGKLHFRIKHRFREPGTVCAPGEEVAAVFLLHRGREFYVPLSLTLRLVFDFMAKHRRFPQSASQIAACFRADPFYTHHGSNIAPDKKLKRRVARSAVRVYVQRIRTALATSFQDAHLHLDPRDVLASEKTMMNEVNYHLKGTFEWLHIDNPVRKP